MRGEGYNNNWYVCDEDQMGRLTTMPEGGWGEV